MSENKAAILEALSMLEADNADHWTTEGLPKVEVIEDATGLELKRKDITEAAPLFNKTNMELETEVPTNDPEADPDAPVLADDADASDAEQEATGLTADEEVSAFLEKANSDAEARNHPAIVEAAKAVDEAVKAKMAADKALAQAHADHKAAVDKYAPKNDPRSNQLAIMAHIEGQKKQREARAAEAAALKEAMGQVSRAPIDETSQRQLGHGHQRPAFPPKAGTQE